MWTQISPVMISTILVDKCRIHRQILQSKCCFHWDIPFTMSPVATIMVHYCEHQMMKDVLYSVGSAHLEHYESKFVETVSILKLLGKMTDHTHFIPTLVIYHVKCWCIIKYHKQTNQSNTRCISAYQTVTH